MANWSDNSTCMAGLQVGSGIVEEHTCVCGALEDGKGNQMHSHIMWWIWLQGNDYCSVECIRATSANGLWCTPEEGSHGKVSCHGLINCLKHRHAHTLQIAGEYCIYLYPILPLQYVYLSLRVPQCTQSSFMYCARCDGRSDYQREISASSESEESFQRLPWKDKISTTFFCHTFV